MCGVTYITLYNFDPANKLIKIFTTFDILVVDDYVFISIRSILLVHETNSVQHFMNNSSTLWSATWGLQVDLKNQNFITCLNNNEVVKYNCAKYNFIAKINRQNNYDAEWSDTEIRHVVCMSAKSISTLNDIIFFKKVTGRKKHVESEYTRTFNVVNN